MSKDEMKNYRIEYYKGLGKNTAKDIEDDNKTASTVVCVYDDKLEDTFDVAFDKYRVPERKNWIAEWRDATKEEDISFQSFE